MSEYDYTYIKCDFLLSSYICEYHRCFVLECSFIVVLISFALIVIICGKWNKTIDYY